jgi:hypothetical protein
MKIDDKTVSILKNFSSINPSILIEEGNVITTVTPTKTVLAKATVPTTFDKRFAIYNLSQFLGLFSLIQDPEFEFNDTHAKVYDSKTKNTSYKFVYADESNIKVPPKKLLSLPSVNASIDLSETSFREVIRASSMFGLPEIVFVGDGTDVFLQTMDSKNSSSNVFSIKISETDKVYRAIFKTENLVKIISGDYKIDISSKGISYFKGDGIEYWVAVEQTSTF